MDARYVVPSQYADQQTQYKITHIDDAQLLVDKERVFGTVFNQRAEFVPKRNWYQS